MPDNYRPPVIYYHSIGPVKNGWIRKFLTLDPDSFELHLNYFARHYTVISLKENWMILNGLIPPVKNPLVITFDDGYLDNWIWVFPLLKKYELKATIFISPDFIDNHAKVRPNLEDYLRKKVNLEELQQWGFLSWEEMKLMEDSGIIDIQSHTKTHTKYFTSDIIVDFHHPGADILYPVSNKYPERKPFYIHDPDFENLLPYGFPLFEESSAVIARKVTINPDFINKILESLKGYDFSQYHYPDVLNLIKPFYNSYKTNGKIILSVETEAEYLDRVSDEIIGSKQIIEKKLNKKVEFLCWPHGENNEFLHQMAIDAGYLMTTTGKAKGIKKNDRTRIPERLGIDFSSPARRIKTIFKLKALSRAFPYHIFLNASRKIRY